MSFWHSHSTVIMTAAERTSDRSVATQDNTTGNGEAYSIAIGIRRKEALPR